MDGLNLAGEAFGKKFKVTSAGMKRAHWAHNSESLDEKTVCGSSAMECYRLTFQKSIMFNTEVFLSMDDYRKQAKKLAGSRDFGAQLFCALLRSAAVEARLVCSLQPLPFSGVTKNVTPVKSKPYYATIPSDNHGGSSSETSRAGSSSNTPRSETRRLAQPHFPPSRPATPSVMGKWPREN